MHNLNLIFKSISDGSIFFINYAPANYSSAMLSSTQNKGAKNYFQSFSFCYSEQLFSHHQVFLEVKMIQGLFIRFILLLFSSYITHSFFNIDTVSVAFPYYTSLSLNLRAVHYNSLLQRQFHQSDATITFLKQSLLDSSSISQISFLADNTLCPRAKLYPPHLIHF